MEFLRAFTRVLTKRRALPLLETLREKTAFFKPSDWLVVFVLMVIMGLSAATMLAGVSLALTVKVPARGGVYTEGVIGNPRFVNPLLSISETDQDLSALIFSGLLKKNPDGTLSPDIAESYTISDDGRTYTFVLKDARFHDGTSVTADDVAFTVRGAHNPDIKSPRRADWEGVEVVVIDTKTILFTLNEPYAPFLQNMTLGILPKHLWENVTAEEFPFTTLNTRPIGSGPFFVEAVRENRSGIPAEYRLRAFQDGVRIPYIDRFIMKFYSNENDLKEAVNHGDVEAANSLNPADFLKGHTVYEAVFGRIFGVFFNQNQNGVFADAVVRKALDAALDKKAIVSIVLGGYGSVIDGPLPREHIRTDSADERSPEERLNEARALLLNAGWKAGEGGVFEKTTTVKKKKETVRLSFSLSTSNVPELKRVAELIAETWKSLGADVSVKFFEQNDLSTEVLRPRKYDALLFGEVVGREPDLFAFWHSSQMSDPGLNIALYANTDTDENLELARTDINPDVRQERLRRAAKEITDEAAAVFLYAPHFVYLAPKNVSGVMLGTIARPADRFDAVEKWYLSSERVWPVFTRDVERAK